MVICVCSSVAQHPWFSRIPGLSSGKFHNSILLQILYLLQSLNHSFKYCQLNTYFVPSNRLVEYDHEQNRQKFLCSWNLYNRPSFFLLLVLHYCNSSWFPIMISLPRVRKISVGWLISICFVESSYSAACDSGTGSTFNQLLTDINLVGRNFEALWIAQYKIQVLNERFQGQMLPNRAV